MYKESIGELWLPCPGTCTLFDNAIPTFSLLGVHCLSVLCLAVLSPMASNNAGVPGINITPGCTMLNLVITLITARAQLRRQLVTRSLCLCWPN